MRIIVCGLLGILISLVMIKTCAFFRDYTFVVAEGKVYRCNQRTGKITLVTCSTGVVYGERE